MILGGTGSAGGLVGTLENSGSIVDAYSAAYTSGSGTVGGLVGANNSGAVTNGYWDTQVSGQSSSASGTGQTTAQLQASLPTGFSSSTWGQISGVSYPYLLAFYSSAPRVISGSSNASGNSTVTLAVNGTNVSSNGLTRGTTQTGANGYYYFLEPNAAIANSSAMLTYLSGTGGNAITTAPTSGGSISKLDLFSNRLQLGGSNTTSISPTTLSAAKGGLSSGILFSLSGSNLALNNNVSLVSSTTTTTNMTGALTASGTGTLTFNGPVAINNAGAAINSAGNQTYNNAVTLTSNGLFTTNGTLTFAGAINGGASDFTSNSSVFVNSVGSSLFGNNNANIGQFNIWSANPTNDTVGGLTYNFKQYNATYGVSSVLGSGNGLFYTYAPTFTPTLIGTVSKTYNSNNTATLNSTNYATAGFNGDTVTLTNPAGTYNSIHVGTGLNVAVSGLSIANVTNGSATVYGYTLSSSSANANIGVITAAPLTVNLIGTTSKVYDTTTSAILAANNYSLSGVIGSDIVNLNKPTSGTYDTKNVGTGKTTSVSGLSISGANSSDYALSSTAVNGAIGIITPATVTTNLIGSVSKVYDTTTAATLAPNNYSLTGILGNDIVNLNNPTAGIYNSNNSGTSKTVSVTGLTISGANASNYQLTSAVISAPIGIILAPTMVDIPISQATSVMPMITSQTTTANVNTNSIVINNLSLNNASINNLNNLVVNTNPVSINVPISSLSINNQGVINLNYASTPLIIPVGTSSSMTASLNNRFDNMPTTNTTARAEVNNAPQTSNTLPPITMSQDSSHFNAGQNSLMIIETPTKAANIGLTIHNENNKYLPSDQQGNAFNLVFPKAQRTIILPHTTFSMLSLSSLKI